MRNIWPFLFRLIQILSFSIPVMEYPKGCYLTSYVCVGTVVKGKNLVILGTV